MSVSSPCLGRCQAGGEGCLGCGRTLDEIARWRDMSVEEQQGVWARLQAVTHSCPECGEAVSCAVALGASIATCWCQQLAPWPLPVDMASAVCLCHRCLLKRQQQ